MPPVNTSAKKKRGRGQPRFEPTEEQRALVKMASGCGTAQDDICLLILNPHSRKPIDRNTLAKAFERELTIGKLEIKQMLDATLLAQAKKGSLGHLIWLEKTRLGIRDPSDERSVNAKLDVSKVQHEHKVEVIGGLPANSSAEKPEGDSPEIPPEESHG